MQGYGAWKMLCGLMLRLRYDKSLSALIESKNHNLDKINWLTDTPSSADLMANSLCLSAGTRSVKCPRNFFIPNGSGIAAPSSSSHLMDSPTTHSISFRASLTVLPCAESEGNSKHRAIWQSSSSDQVIRYVYLSILFPMFLRLQFFYGLFYLSYLIRLGHLAVLLQINPRIAHPRCPKNEMAASDPWFTEISTADRNQISE